MQPRTKALAAGVVGSLATNVCHELLRRGARNAPRVDLLGMQAVAGACAALRVPIPRGRALYNLTLAADLVSNAAYFALVGAAPRNGRMRVGTGLGVIAGIGAVTLPKPLGLSPKPTNQTTFTRAATVALYAIGGLAAGWMDARLARDTGDADAFAGKHVALTGGSRGLGFVMARQLLAAGARVSICGRTPESLESARTTLDSAKLTTIACDVRDADDCRRFVDEAIVRNGPIDILINNAGVIEVGPLPTQSIDDFREAMDTHFWGPLQMTLAALPGMRARHAGHIVNVASIGGVMAVPHLAPYCASKFAQIGLTQALGSELALDGIRVTSIVPGLMITGSPEHAVFKGRNRAEFAWFTLSDANPLLSVPASTASRRILKAVALGRAQAVIGAPAKIAQLLNVLAPETTARLLRVAAGLLPPPGGIGAARRLGAQSRSAWTRNPLTWLDADAARKNNQRSTLPEHAPLES